MGDSKKKWWQSKGMWSGLIGIIVSGIGLYDSQTGQNIAGTEVYVTITGILAMLGLYGRGAATKEIE